MMISIQPGYWLYVYFGQGNQHLCNSVINHKGDFDKKHFGQLMDVYKEMAEVIGIFEGSLEMLLRMMEKTEFLQRKLRLLLQKEQRQRRPRIGLELMKSVMA